MTTNTSYTAQHMTRAVELMAKMLRPTEDCNGSALTMALALILELDLSDVLQGRLIVQAHRENYSLQESLAYAEGVATSFILGYTLYRSQDTSLYSLGLLLQLLMAACLRCAEQESYEEI